MVYKVSSEDIVADYARYAGLNPAYAEDETGDLQDPRAAKELMTLSHRKGSGELEDLRSAREIEVRTVLFGHAIREKIEQMEVNSMWGKKGRAAAKEFKKSPRTFVKTAQEIFVHPTDRMVFERSDDLGQALYDMIIDPRLISDAVLENFGLSEFIIEGRATQEKRLLRRAEAIPRIREMLSKLEAIRLPHQQSSPAEDLKYFRLMRIGFGANTGYVVGTQSVGGKKVMFKSDIYSAERRIAHIRNDYDLEIQKLKVIEKELSDFREGLAAWANPKKQLELEVKLKALEDIVESLTFVRDDHKESLKKRLEQCMTFKDSLERNNPQSKGALLTGAINSIGKRIKNIEGISAELGRDKVIVKDLIEGQIAPMRTFYETVQKLHERFRIFRADEELSDQDKDKILDNLTALRRDAGSMIFQPDTSFGKKFIEQIDKTIERIQGGNFAEAAKEFLKMYLIVKIKKAHVQLHGFHSKLSLYPEFLEVGPAVNRLERIRKDLAEKDVADGISTKEYDAAYGAIYHLLHSLKARLLELMDGREKPEVHARAEKIASELQKQIPLFPLPGEDIPLANKLAMIEVMKERMDGFSFEELLGGL